MVWKFPTSWEERTLSIWGILVFWFCSLDRRQPVSHLLGARRVLERSIYDWGELSTRIQVAALKFVFNRVVRHSFSIAILILAIAIQAVVIYKLKVSVDLLAERVGALEKVKSTPSSFSWYTSSL